MKQLHQVGYTFSPVLCEWQQVQELSKEDMWKLLLQVLPSAKISHHVDVTAESIHNGENRMYDWMTHVAVVVELTDTKVIALHRGDFKYWVIEQPIGGPADGRPAADRAVIAGPV